MSWLYEGSIFDDSKIPEGAVGFVYRMGAIIDGKAVGYIGKKNFTASRKKPLSKKLLSKDKRHRKYVRVTKSSYQNYYSSNETLKQAHKDGIIIQRTILKICFSKTELTYYEVKTQFSHEVLEHDLWLNGNILGRWFRNKPK